MPTGSYDRGIYNVGDIRKNKHGQSYMITGLSPINREYLIKWLDTGNVESTRTHAMLYGKVRNPQHCYGTLGQYMGSGYRKTLHFNRSIYRTQTSMLGRCNTSVGCYKDVTVDPRFLNYMYFREWYLENKVCPNTIYHLDKDIVNPTARCYSPETCLLVPPEINSFFGVGKSKLRSRGVNYTSGFYYPRLTFRGVKYKLGSFSLETDARKAYITKKKEIIKFLADENKEIITCRAYLALINHPEEEL